LMQLVRGDTAPTSVMEVPSGQVVVGHTVLYVVQSVGDFEDDILVLGLGGGTPTTIVRHEYLARDFAVAGDTLYWRAGWAGLEHHSISVRSLNPSTGVRTVEL